MKENYKELFEELFSNLYNSKLIYHERITFLCQLVSVVLTDTDYKVEIKIIKPLSDVSMYQGYYQALLTMPSIKVGGSYKFGDIKCYDGKKIGGSYSPLLWVDNKIVQQFFEAKDDELEKMVDELLWK